MKKFVSKLLMTGLVCAGLWMGLSTPADASEYRIPDGVEVSGVDLSGMTSEEAKNAVNAYVDEVKSQSLYLTDDDEFIDVPFADIGMDIADASVIDSLSKVGSGGNILKRYKELADVQNGNASYTISFTCDLDALQDILAAKEDEINREPQNASIVRREGKLQITEGYNGRVIDIQATVDNVAKAMDESWDNGTLEVAMVLDETEPEHTTEEIAQIDTEIGTYSTSFYGSSSNRIANIQNGCRLIDETTLFPGETFSFTEMVAPFTSANGYYIAGGYSAGRTVDSMGGGICQVSSTLYNAVLRAELTIVERLNHIMTVGYVPLAADATISEGAIDFKFRNDFDFPIYIEAYTYNGSVTVAIYGKETRPANRTIEFISVTEQTIAPPADKVEEDPTQPTDYEKVTDQAHTGYVASLYKIVYIDGVEQSREHVNRSTYNAYPRYVIRGTKEEETEALETEAPAPETQAPAPETQAPAPETQTPAPETQAPAPETQAPAPETQAPAPETQAPAPETQAPAPETQAPAPETQTPAPAAESTEAA